MGDDHGQDADDLQDFNEDLNDDHPNATFSLSLLSGETVTGNLTFGHGAQLGDFTLNGITYFFRRRRSHREITSPTFRRAALSPPARVS